MVLPSLPPSLPGAVTDSFFFPGFLGFVSMKVNFTL